MCEDCGCSTSGPYQVDGRFTKSGSHGHDHSHPHSHEHGYSHDHDHHHQDHGHSHSHHVVDVNKAVLCRNDRAAERNRGAFQALGLLTINVLSSPGSGKTMLLQKTFAELKDRLRGAVIVGDLATENDATRLRTTGVPVVQISTGTMCHLEAEMVANAMSKLDLRTLDLLVIENVGNLVCPASFDLGEALRVVLLSVTEGEDKPLKYPPMFHSADVVIVTKTDMAEAAGFDRELALRNLRQASPHAKLFELSARTGQGMQEWCDYLLAQQAR